MNPKLLVQVCGKQDASFILRSCCALVDARHDVVHYLPVYNAASCMQITTQTDFKYNYELKVLRW